jgi:uncharacterized protein (TIGR03546 family)
MFWLKLLKNFLQVLQEGQTPNQIAWGFALGSIAGLSPHFTLQILFVWLIIFILDINLSAAFLGATVFAIIAFLFDRVFHAFGFALLTIEGLRGFYTTLYNAPIAPLTKFNNTVVMGSFIAAIILVIPVYFGMKIFVIKYRLHLHDKIVRWKIYQIIKRSTLYGFYEKVRSLGGLR